MLGSLQEVPADGGNAMRPASPGSTAQDDSEGYDEHPALPASGWTGWDEDDWPPHFGAARAGVP